MRVILICLALLAMTGCPREGEPVLGDSGQPRVTHPWELPGSEFGQLAKAIEGQQHQQSGGGVETPVARGPAFNEQDTLDTEKLPGMWLQVCQSNNEQLSIVPTQEMDVIEFAANGNLAFHIYQAGELIGILDGNWRKVRPGVLAMNMGEEEEAEFYCELYNDHFFFLWSYDLKLGQWFVRLLPDGPASMATNLFQTSRGEFHIENMVGDSYEGKVTGETTLDVMGYFNNGVLSMRWLDDNSDTTGFAAFLVDAECQRISGAWWVDDYEAAPFGGAWGGATQDFINSQVEAQGQ